MLKMLSGDRSAALASLERDVELGDTDYEYLRNDEVFLPLQGDPLFESLIRRMRTRATKAASQAR